MTLDTIFRISYPPTGLQNYWTDNNKNSENSDEQNFKELKEIQELRDLFILGI